MRHGSLESGIGGFDYAAEMMGWENVFNCEINPFGRRILDYYWPNTKHYADVFEFDGTIWRGKVDIITCGFPCQPFSVAGKRKGSSDDRHIWPENMRIIREAGPRFVVAENVPGLLTIEDGMVFERVCLDLEDEGYEVTPLVIPACATGAPHRRDSVWIVASHPGRINSALPVQQRRQDTAQDLNAHWAVADDTNAYGAPAEHAVQAGRHLLAGEACHAPYTGGINGQHLSREPGEVTAKVTHSGDHHQSAIYTDSRGLQRPQHWYSQIGRKAQGERCEQTDFTSGPDTLENWLEAATRLCGVDDGTAGRLDTAAISKGKWRTESLRGYGNAIVWTVAYQIFQAIEASLFPGNYEVISTVTQMRTKG